MKIATWNVNGIRSRMQILEEWIRANNPSIIMLQELKCLNEQLPAEILEDLGYNIASFGQKGRNGVAILSKFPIEDVQEGIPGYDDASSRYIEVFTNKMRVVSVYVPNGQSLDSDQYIYKLLFFDHLKEHLKKLIALDEVTVIGGDFNVALKNEDVHDPVYYKDSVCFSKEERQKMNALLNLNYTDALRASIPYDPKNPGPFTWWDYRTRAFTRNAGMRLDYILLSPRAADLHILTQIDIIPRNLDKTSDHAPVICELRKG